MLRLSVPDPTETTFDFISGGAASNTGDEALLKLSEAVFSLDPVDLPAARDAVTRSHGPGAMVDALAIAAHFNAITKVADSTGIQLETVADLASEDIRKQQDLDRLRPANRSYGG